jgi:hypothetical protein
VAIFLGNNAAPSTEKARFCKLLLLLKNSAKQVCIRNPSRNRNQIFSKVRTGTGTAKIHYCSTTLHKTKRKAAEESKFLKMFYFDNVTNITKIGTFCANSMVIL